MTIMTIGDMDKRYLSEKVSPIGANGKAAMEYSKDLIEFRFRDQGVDGIHVLAAVKDDGLYAVVMDPSDMSRKDFRDLYWQVRGALTEDPKYRLYTPDASQKFEKLKGLQAGITLEEIARMLS